MPSPSEPPAGAPLESAGPDLNGNKHRLPPTNGIPVASAVMPEPVEACVHSLVKRTAIEQPSSPAVCAWDGTLEYGQLDCLSSRLARHLVSQGVTQDAVVILCFEKCLLAPVAVLGVAKAGCASIFLDVTQSQDHLRAITAQVPRPICLSSPANCHLARQLVASDVVVLDKELLSDMEINSVSPLPELPIVSPSDTLNVIFASAEPCSRPVPRGIAVTHRNMSTAILYQQKALGYTSESRVFDIAPQG